VAGALELHELTKRALELDPPAEPFTSDVDAEAAAARSARWREADAKYWERRRELERDLGRSDPTLAPGRRETLERELQEHIKKGPPSPAAPPSE
jgi:hypothetical protein